MSNVKIKRGLSCLASAAKKNRVLGVSSAIPAGVMFGLLGLLAPWQAIATIRADMQFPHALTPAFRWSEPIEMRLSGVPVVVRGFAAALTLEQAARSMSNHKNRFQRVTTLPGSILLSGVHKGHHWVAQLEAGQGQIKGLVSALPIGLESRATETESMGFLAPWLTQNARFVFGQSSTQGGFRAAQTVHVPNQPMGEFISALGGRLVSAGWRRSGSHTWSTEPSKGSLDSRRIEVFPVSLPGTGGAVFIHQSE